MAEGWGNDVFPDQGSARQSSEANSTNDEIEIQGTEEYKSFKEVALRFLAILSGLEVQSEENSKDDEKETQETREPEDVRATTIPTSTHSTAGCVQDPFSHLAESGQFKTILAPSSLTGSTSDQLPQSADAYTRLGRDMQTKQTKILELESKVRDLNLNNTEMNNKIQQARQEHSNINNEMQQLQNKTLSLQQEINIKRNKIQQLENEIVFLQEENNTKNNEILRLKQENNVQNNEMQQLRNEMQQLQNEMQQLQNEMQELRQVNSNMNNVITERGSVTVSDEILGNGGWGIVKRGDFYGTKVAVKEFHEIILSSYNMGILRREINIASQCRHPNLLQFICATQNDRGHLLIVTELMDMSLRKLIEQRASAQLQLEYEEVKLISLDVARGLNYLHSKKPNPIIHRDVSSANVLLWIMNGAGRAKLSDYGSANYMQVCKTAHPGAVLYAAPEANQARQDPKMDVFSYGVLVCEMCILELPDPMDRVGQRYRITNVGIKELVTRCTMQNPQGRPTMQQAIRCWEN